MSKEKTTQQKRTIGDRVEGRIYEKRMSKIDVVRKSGVNKVALYKIIAGGGYTMDSFILVCDALDVDIILKPRN